MTDVVSVDAVELLSATEGITIVTPNNDTRVYKDECVYCFHTPFFPGGLFISLSSYCGFCEKHALKYAKSSGCLLFLQIESKKVSISMDTSTETGEPKDKVTKLAIGVDNGFDSQKVELEDTYHLAMFTTKFKRCSVSNELGQDLYNAAQYVITSTSAERLELLQSTTNAWDGELKQVTKLANLTQIDNGKIIPSSGWKCEETSCDLEENLWLNLTDGTIKCGRQQFIAEGTICKGNGHMRQHCEATGFSLVVKLGTISKEGSADVYSYDEDDAVIDPNLNKHLAHWGIDPEKWNKTEKSTLEMELDMNQKWEWAKCQEDGASLEPIFGQGYTGLVNIGSSCYINSVMQALLMVPEMRIRFAEQAEKTLRKLTPIQVHTDFNAQCIRLVSAMLSGEYAKDGSDLNGIKPKQFKRVIAGNHPEFSTGKQQDAEEYARYLLEKISTNSPADEIDPSYSLRFRLESRFEDCSTHGVRYSDREELLLPVRIPQEVLTPHPTEENRFVASLAQCLAGAFTDNIIEDFVSTVTGEKAGAKERMRFKTFPDFLLLQLQRFTISDNYTIKKLDVDVEVPDELDLSGYRGVGKQPDETLLPENVTVPSAPQLTDQQKTIVQALEGMGFSHNASIKGTLAAPDMEGAANWVMSHLDDPDLNDPPHSSSQTPQVPQQAAEQRECVQQLLSFGFTMPQACYALKKFPDANAAAEWLFEHSHEVPAEEEVVPEPVAVKREFRDGNGQYRLVGLISHMGSSPHSGHYVAHMYKDRKWNTFSFLTAYPYFTYGPLRLLSAVEEYMTQKRRRSMVLFRLVHRTVLVLKGADALPLLQGLVTNDVRQLDGIKQIASLFLNTKGRIIEDLLLSRKNENEVYVECGADSSNDVAQLLTKYRLRKKVEIIPSDINVYHTMDQSGERFGDETLVSDGRYASFGSRIFSTKSLPGTDDISEYQKQRRQLGIAEGAEELRGLLPFQVNGDLLNMVCLNKGCYIGQELTARSAHTGVVRRRVVPFKSEVESVNGQIKNSQDKAVGKVISYGNGWGLALVSLQSLKNDVFCNGKKIVPQRPPWMPENVWDGTCKVVADK